MGGGGGGGGGGKSILGHGAYFPRYLTVKTEDKNRVMFLSSIWVYENSSSSQLDFCQLTPPPGGGVFMIFATKTHENTSSHLLLHLWAVFDHENTSSSTSGVFLTMKTPPSNGDMFLSMKTFAQMVKNT